MHPSTSIDNAAAASVPGGSGLSATKLHAPQPPPGSVARSRLTERLDPGATRLVLVCAPAGFGKTVATRQWLQRERLSQAWLSLDEGDNDPRRFFGHLAAAIRALGSRAAERAASLVAALGASSPGAEVPAELFDALEELGSGAAIVLDDLHQVETTAIFAVLQRLIDGNRSGARIVLISRVDPPLALGRLRASGAVFELREQELRFTKAETAEFLATQLPQALDTDLVDQLERRTEGWVAGLRMAALALQRADDPRSVIESFGGSHRFVVEYLLEEAVSRQREEVQRFLMETSVLHRFTADTCAAVTGDPAAATLLEEVERANLFLVPLGEEGTWFRYHHLFAELLEFRLRRLQRDRSDVLHERACRWFEAHGDVHQALEHASRTRDPALLLELLDTHAFALLRRSELASLGRWTKRVPDPLAQPFPTFLIALGWLRILTERAPDLEPLLHAVGDALENAPAGYDASARQRTRTELDILRAFAARFAGRLSEAMETGARALSVLPADAVFARGRLLYNQARIHTTLGEMRPAAELLRRSFDDNLAAGNFYLVLTGLAQMGGVLVQTDGCGRAIESLLTAVRFAEERGLARLPAMASVFYQLGYAHLVADGLDEAEAHLRRSVAMCAGGGFPEGQANGLVGLARVHAARGAFHAARAALAEAMVLAHDQNTLLLDSSVELERLRLDLLQDTASGSRPGRWLEDERSAEHGWTTLLETGMSLRLNLCLRSGETDEAARLAERLLRESEPRGRGVATCVARAAAAVVVAEADQRWSALDEALGMAAAYGYMRPLLELGEPMRALLQAALSRPLSVPARRHAETLIERFQAVREQAPAPDRLAPVALTDREREALHYLLRGHSNKAIARAMFVSGETVKTHLKHLYAKLGVASRRDAVAQARALGLATETLG
jgi:LuxR family transcriptional regulator, maltose regulon positive regulatory protein